MKYVFAIIASSLLLVAAGCADKLSGASSGTTPTSTGSGTSQATSTTSGWNAISVSGGTATSTVAMSFPGALISTSGEPSVVFDADLGTAVEHPGSRSVPDRIMRVFVMPSNDNRLNGCAFSELGWSGRSASSTPNLTFGSSPFTFCGHAEEDAGAGNRYNIRTYTTPLGQNVLAVEFIVHSVACQNFPNPSAQCVAYDESRDTAIDAQILGMIQPK